VSYNKFWKTDLTITHSIDLYIMTADLSNNYRMQYETVQNMPSLLVLP
jgi:hypothetical protein